MEKTNKRNEGFSLVEMIIVLAIVAVVSTMSILSIGIINTAKAKDAASVFDSEVASVHAKAKGMAVDLDNNGTITDEELKYTYCIKLYKQSGGNDYYLCVGYCKPESSQIVTSFTSATTANGGLGRNLSSHVRIRYNGNLADGTAVSDYDPGDGTNAIYIVFNKRGECVCGSGEFEFQKKNGNTIARKYIRANGSHGSK
jgi:prepilin-type N-terminal cleavage/methylation domain-containing protein